MNTVRRFADCEDCYFNDERVPEVCEDCNHGDQFEPQEDGDDEDSLLSRSRSGQKAVVIKMHKKVREAA